MQKVGILEQKIGIIGGGQLGKMMVLEAKKMGFFVTILDPTPHCPAHSVADVHIIAGFNDEVGYRRLAEASHVITYEFEHIDVGILKDLETEGHTIYPTVQSLEIIQNKYSQKMRLKEKGIPVPEFISTKTLEDISSAADLFGYPMVLKSCTGGYDGKGNAVIFKEIDCNEAYKLLGEGNLPLMVERFVPFTKEISVLACRGIEGTTAVYPVGENEHRDSILMETRVPAELSEALTHQAMELARDVMEVFEGVGMFCVELFVTQDEQLMVNEVAPRPHNSGHYSIEGCMTCQFQQHIRAVTGLPLGATTLLRPTVMGNILGEEGYTGKAELIGMEEALRIQGTSVHIYGKQDTSPKRKMGHFTVLADTVEEAAQKAALVHKVVKMIGSIEI